ncbi:hypothetical protein GpartN1_g5485.t1 [Galdieria partita]|uniref:Thioredoxin domain-containing protein n=1 Tax=Galdieria partita TaxID=83374 RepID=A0A9C7PZZ7_9RHOD|nr:hypothetical protein GpartN1_g5485.t1 [Galdieria partita]
MEDSLVFHHDNSADSALFTNSTAIFILTAFVVSWSADCYQLLQTIGDLSQHCQERGWQEDIIQFHIFHADNNLDKLPIEIPFFPTIFFCLGKIESRVCQKYQAAYSLENLSFLVFSKLVKAFPGCAVELKSANNSHQAISLLRNRSSRFPYQQVAIMVPSQYDSRIEDYTKLFKELARKFFYMDFFIFSVTHVDNRMQSMIFSDSHFEDGSKSWRSFLLKDAVDGVTLNFHPKFLRWLWIGSPYSHFAPITPETYNNASREEWFHLVVIPNRCDPQALDYEYLLWEFSVNQCQNMSLHSTGRSCHYYSMSYSSFEPFLKGLGVFIPEEASDSQSHMNSRQAQVVIIDRQKEAWMRLPLYLLDDISLFHSIYSEWQNMNKMAGDTTQQALSTYKVPKKLFSSIDKWKSPEYGQERKTIMMPQQISTDSFLYTLQGPAHLEQLWKANTQTVHIVIFYVPWCIFCQQALPAYSYIANHVDQNLLRIYQYNCQQYSIPRQWDSWIDGFPTVLIFPSKYFKKPFIYEGPHTVEAITDYLQTRCLNMTMSLF